MPGTDEVSDSEVPLPPEKSEDELEERHAREQKELEEKVRAHLEAARASAGKGKKAKAAIEAAERDAESWQYDLRTRQIAELERFSDQFAQDGRGNSASAAGASELVQPVPGAGASACSAVADDEAERARQKKEKALRKRQGRAAKEADREAEIEREKLEAGPSARELELAALNAQLAKLRLQVHEVAADGNCLYHAVGDQLCRVGSGLYKWRRKPAGTYEEVRALCATGLRGRADLYAAFAELKDGEDFEGYCCRVEHSTDWGGELELRALADELGVRILVYRADESQPHALGAEGDDSPVLQVVYHRHYYTLGEHYNSVVPLQKS